MRTAAGGAVLAALVALGGCSSDEPANTETTAESSAAATRYVTVDSEGWTLKEAVDPAAGSSIPNQEAGLDWWAEYERFVPVQGGTEGLDLRISGHDMDPSVATPGFRAGFEMHEGEVAGGPARWGTSVEGKPAFVMIDTGDDYTVMLLSYALPVDELRRIAADEIASATEAQWVANGGEVRRG